MSWWWRTKPRSIIRTVQWFNYFGKLEGKNWNLEDRNQVSSFDLSKIHPIRREYIFSAHSEEDSNIGRRTLNKYLSGKYDTRETESNGRNDKITYEFFGFGYVDSKGLIKVTDVGNKIINGNFDGEDYLKQLLKLQFPNPISRGNNFENDEFIYPMQLILKAFERFESLNRSELVLLFGCNSIKKTNNVLEGIARFKKEYELLNNKNDTSKVKKLCEKIFFETYGCLDNKIGSYYDYAEALCRCLNYTGLFKTSGRSIATKLRVAEYSKIKFDLLLHKYDFKKQVFSNVEEYMDWFGKTSSTNLPWNNIEARRDIVKEKIEFIKNYENDKAFITKFGNESLKVVKEKVEYASNVINSNSTYDELKTVENNLVDFITSIKEKQFIEVYSKTSEAKQEILDMYDQILEKIDMGALWLEVNTWKSLIAVGGNKIVKRNFNVEEDLTPKSFAPGIGNTPDMELYTDEYIIIPEVSLMTGTQQWEHEASSVIDHVLSFIKDNNDKTVRGLFISSSLNIRTKWQFFILNKESWVEKPVPVIPLTIGQYKFIIETIYNQNLEIMELIKVLEEIHEIAKKSQNYTEWFDKTSIYVQNWKSAVTLRV